MCADTLEMMEINQTKVIEIVNIFIIRATCEAIRLVKNHHVDIPCWLTFLLKRGSVVPPRITGG